jgi:vacuolar protein sorting-associated protein 52
MKYRSLVHFLKSHGPDMYAEIRTAYISTLSALYSHHFRSYLVSLDKLRGELAGRRDALGGGGEGGGKGEGGVTGRGIGGGGGDWTALLARAKSAAAATSAGTAPGISDLSRANIYVAGPRLNVLKQIDQPAIIPHMMPGFGAGAKSPFSALSGGGGGGGGGANSSSGASATSVSGGKIPYEIAFRSIHKLLIDTATSEYLFTYDFFGEDSVFFELFSHTVLVVEGSLAIAVSECHDALGLLLMIRLTYQFHLTMARRRVPTLDDYFDRVNLLLWPRFKQVRREAEESMFPLTSSLFHSRPLCLSFSAFTSLRNYSVTRTSSCTLYKIRFLSFFIHPPSPLR